MTTANIESSIQRALALKPDEGQLPKVSKQEAQHVVAAARQGAGPDAHAESVFVAAFVLGPEHPHVREMLADAEVEVPSFGEPGRDYVIDPLAAKVFDSYFHRHAVPVAGARAAIVAEMTGQLLNLGSPRVRPPAGFSYRVDLDGAYIGRLDANAKTFFIEETDAGGGRSRYFGPFQLDGHPDFGKR
jgi:hypothetical protein